LGFRPICGPEDVVWYLDLATFIFMDTGCFHSTSIRSLMDSSTTATKTDVEAHFNTHGTGEITEIKLMNGFGFIEYKDAMDARDVVPGELYSYLCPTLGLCSD
jgi:hypothetical protein